MVIASFICGCSNSLPRGHDDLEFHTANSTPSKPCHKSKGAKNPYSSRGLDKFYALLAEMEEKKRTIYSQIGEEEISMVWFVYTNDNSCRPILVKARGKKEPSSESQNKSGPLEYRAASAVLPAPGAVMKQNPPEKTEKNKLSKFNQLKRLKQPSCYWLVILVLILVFLAFFGRSVAILCTSVGWYLVPTITNGESNLRRSMKKKDYARKLSDKKMLDHDPKSPGDDGLHKSH